jgi:hypothetical protein
MITVAPIAVREFLDPKVLMQNTHNHKLKGSSDNELFLNKKLLKNNS